MASMSLSTKSNLSMMSTASLSVPEGKRAKALVRQIYNTKKIGREDVEWLLEQVKPIFVSQPMLVEVTPPLSICGDTHGQLNDVVRLFNQNGWPPKMRYLFLGDYVDRGPKNVETACLMFALKIRYPTNFYLLRGNHETRSINRAYGFYAEVTKLYPKKDGQLDLYNVFNDVFDWMPIAGLVAGRILCMHGGISPDLTDLDQIRNIPRPLTEEPDTGLVADLMWADPEKGIKGFMPSSRGISFLFGANAVVDLCEALGLDMIARAHQVVNEGYEFFADERMITVFSAPDYCNQFTNSAGILYIEADLNCRIKQLKSKKAKGKK